jgi:hypothetical protein
MATALLLAVTAAGCSSTTAPRRVDLAASQVATLVQRMTLVAVQSLAGVELVGALPAAAPRAARGFVSLPLTSQLSCDLGGTIALSGTVAGNLADATGNGTLAVNAAETLDGCRTTIEANEIIISGTLAIGGDFVVANNQRAVDQTATFSGNLDMTVTPSGSGRCTVDLTVNYNLTTLVFTVNGTACGYPIVL